MSHKYKNSELPDGFQYPSSFDENIFLDSHLYPWIPIECDSEVGQLLLNLGSASSEILIPFASLENGDGDAACFVGRDLSGNPVVKILVLDGSGRSYGYNDFDHWLEHAKKEAKKWSGQ